MTLKELAEQIKIIRDNHLAHLKQDVDRVEHRLEKMDARIWYVLIILIGVTVLPVIGKLF